MSLNYLASENCQPTVFQDILSPVRCAQRRQGRRTIPDPTVSIPNHWPFTLEPNLGGRHGEDKKKVSNSPGSFVPDMVSVLKVSNSPRNMVIISKSRKQESEENKYLQNSIKHLINQGMLCLFSSNIVMHEFSWLLENIDFKSCTSWSRRSFLFLQIPLGSNVIDIFSWKGNMYSRKYIYCQAVSTEKRWEMWINFISSLPIGEAHFFDSLLQ